MLIKNMYISVEGIRFLFLFLISTGTFWVLANSRTTFLTEEQDKCLKNLPSLQKLPISSASHQSLLLVLPNFTRNSFTRIQCEVMQHFWRSNILYHPKLEQHQLASEDHARVLVTEEGYTYSSIFPVAESGVTRKKHFGSEEN